VAVDRYGDELATTLARAPRIPSSVDFEPYPAGLVRATPVRLSTDSA
jgi:hypothetical protein